MRWVLVVLLLAAPAEALAQLDGSVSVMFDVLPDTDDDTGRQYAAEMRTRLFVEHRRDFGSHVRLNLAAYVDGLIGRRSALTDAGPFDTRTSTDAVVRPGDLYVEFVSSSFDVRAGASRLVWGRLDEFQPTDVVNPIDLSRFLLEGRTEARLPVALVRARAFLPRSSTLEAVVVPDFRRSRFDQLDEESSPFNLAALPGVATRREEPASTWTSLQGGARFTSTAGRVDWGVSGYRGFRTFPVLTLVSAASPTFAVVESFPRFSMIGGDFETVRGPWGLRGEVAAFVRDELQSTRAVTGVPGRSVEAGVGFDRRTGDYRVAANVLWSRRVVDGAQPLGRMFEGDDEVERSDVSLVMAVDRSFLRDTRTVRVFGVYDPADETLFARTIVNVGLRDNVALEGSAGVFAGSSPDTLGRLTRRDFFYTRLKVFF